MRKATILRKVDKLGRIVLPIEVRRLYNIEEGCFKVECYLDELQNLVIANPNRGFEVDLKTIIKNDALTDHDKLKLISEKINERILERFD